MAKLSVIMTIYNMADYLKDSIESVLCQSYTDLELILVVDGGEDSSLDICLHYAETDDRIICIQKDNNGTGAARNDGIAVASGTYVGFIDGDDWIEPWFYQQLIGALEQSSSDIACCGFIKVENRQELKRIDSNELSELHVYSSEEAIAMTFEKDKMRYSPCNKVYRRELFNQVLYPVGVLYEDKATTYKIFHLANKIAYLDTPMYHYYIHQDSVMRRALSSANFCIFSVNEELIEFLKVQYPKLVSIAEKSYLEECESLLIRLSEHNEIANEVLKNEVVEQEKLHCLSVIERLKKRL